MCIIYKMASKHTLCSSLGPRDSNVAHQLCRLKMVFSMLFRLHFYDSACSSTEHFISIFPKSNTDVPFSVFVYT